MYLDKLSGECIFYVIVNKVFLLDRNIAFLAGSIFAVLTILTILDKDVLFAEHVLTIIAGLGKMITFFLLMVMGYSQSYSLSRKLVT